MTITATSVASPSASAATEETIAGITVSVAPTLAKVEAQGTQQFAATVVNDTSNGGVTWAVSCSATQCGSISPAASSNGSSVTYTAPSTPPSSDLAVQVIASSATYTPATATASVTIPAIKVAVAPVGALLPLKSSQPFTAIVSNDPNNGGLSWSLSQNGSACAPACGNIDLNNTSSGNQTTYTAPASMPNVPATSLTATSLTNGSNTATASITLTAGTVQLVPNSMDFGSVRTNLSSPPQVATLTNTGSSALNITGIEITGAFPGDYSQSNNCTPSVAAGMSCSVTVIFTPTAGATRTASISIADNSTDSPQQLSLTGIGRTRGAIAAGAVQSHLAIPGSIAVPVTAGRDAVGTQIVHLTDSTRNDPYLNNGTKRELALRVWYPAAPAQKCQTAEYASPAVWEYFAQLEKVRPFRVTTNSCLNAATSGSAHPVVLFTPGYTATFTDYTFLLEDLASRGYVVVSIAHTYESTAVELNDGTLARSVLGSHLDNSWRGDERTFSFATNVRLQDIEFVLNELGELNTQSAGPFAGQFDLSRVAIAGHSMGGATALLSAQLDQRFKAVVMLDAVVPDAVAKKTTSPVLILAGERKQWDTAECRLWNNLQGPRLAVNLRGAEHVAFSDWIWMAKGAIETGPSGPQNTMAAVRDYVATFLDANLRSEPAMGLLAGPSSDYPDAVVITQGQSLCH